MAGAVNDIKYGFWLGIGIAFSLLLLGMLQALTLRAVAKRSG